MRTLPAFLFSALSALIFVPAALAQGADLFVTKSGPAERPAGSDVEYEVTIENLGPDDAVDAVLSDPVPPGMTLVSATQDSGPAFVCGNQPAVTCTAPLLAAGETATFTFVFNIDPDAAPGTTFTNIATGDSATEDPNEENDSGVAVTTTPQPPRGDLGVLKTSANAAGPDTDVVFTITLTNGGPSAATTVALNDTLPGTLTFVSLDQNGGPTFSCTTPAVGSGGTITCTIASFPTGVAKTFTLTAHVPDDTPSGTVFSNTAVVTASNDPEPENNDATSSFTVSSVDVSVAKDGPATATAGTDLTYTIVVANDGPDLAFDVRLTDTLPAGTTFVSLMQDNGSPASCMTPPVGSTGTITCVFPVLGAPASAQFTLVLRAGDTPSVTNTANVVTESFDGNPSNDSASDTTTITPSADLTVTKSGPATVTAGTNATYTIHLANSGPTGATSVVLTDILPASTTFVSAMQTGGPVFGCTTPDAGTNGTITCTLAAFANGATADFTFVVRVAPSAANGSSIVNAATIAAATGDPDDDDNDSETTATVATSADVGVAKSGPTGAVSGTNVTYTIDVTNSGPSDAATVAMNDVLPPNTTFVSLMQPTGPTFACTTPDAGSGGTVTCTVATLPAGITATFALTLNITNGTTGTVTNTATVTSGTPDPAPANASSSVPTGVTAGPTDVSISKTVEPGSHLILGTATFHITVTNTGAFNDSVGTTVTDVLPPGTTLVSATPSQGTCSGTTTVTCSLGTIVPTGSASIAIVVNLPATEGSLTNTATVANGNGDPNPANNADTATFDVIRAAAIPTLSPVALVLLALALAAVVRMRM